MITIEREPNSAACTARIAGDIDFATVPAIREAISEAIDTGCSNVVIDLSEVAYADSSALGLLVWIDRRLQPEGGKLVLAGADGNVNRVLELSGLIGVAPSVSTADSVTAALGALEPSAERRPPVWTRHIDMPAKVEGMSAIRSQVVDWVRPLGMPEAGLFDVKVAVGEALANAVRHGSPDGGNDVVSIDLIAFEDRIEVLVADRGAGFNGDITCGDDIYASGGRGVMFMRALMDAVEFNPCEGGGTAVRLVKKLPASIPA